MHESLAVPPCWVLSIRRGFSFCKEARIEECDARGKQVIFLSLDLARTPELEP